MLCYRLTRFIYLPGVALMFWWVSLICSLRIPSEHRQIPPHRTFLPHRRRLYSRVARSKIGGHNDYNSLSLRGFIQCAHENKSPQFRQNRFLPRVCEYISIVSIKVIALWEQRQRSPFSSDVPRGGWGAQPPPKFRRPSKIVPNTTRFVKTVKNCWI